MMQYRKLQRWFILFVLIIMLVPNLLASAVILPPPTIQYKGARQTAILRNQHLETLGIAQYWNTKTKFIVELELYDGWLLNEAKVFAGSENQLPPVSDGNVQPGAFPCQRVYTDTPNTTLIQCDLVEELNFTWGSIRTRNVAFHGNVSRLDVASGGLANDTFWAVPVEDDDHLVIKNAIFTPFEVQTWGGYFTTYWTHPDRGHFRGPVAGLLYYSNTQWGVTDDGGGFNYFPDETIHIFLGEIYLGGALADQKISPLDIFEAADLTITDVSHPDNFAAINMAQLLYSLDSEGTPHNGSMITGEVVNCVNQAMGDLYGEGETINFYNNAEVDTLINQTMFYCSGVEGVTLVKVSFEEAFEILKKDVSSNMFRKNVSKTPELSSSKSKLNLMGVWFPALRANNEPTTIEYHDADGNLLSEVYEAKPIVITYTDGVEETGMEDVFVAISRDDGNTFKRMNVARGAHRTSFTLANGEPYYGEAKKPVLQVQGNNILVAWTSKYCHGGRPAYAIDIDPETDEYIYDNAYYEEDIWGVAGPQRSVDYTDEGFPEVGEVPYSCVWAARGTIVTQAMLDNPDSYWSRNNYFIGEIVWFKPERLTSGRRDANQIFMGGADDAGFAIAWQEDPDGLRPGQAKGPGPGWGGATTNHKTDIWYSYIAWDDFRVVDENFVSHGEQEQKSHEEDAEILGRPKALVPMSLPMRVTDNDTLNTDNLMVQLDGNGYPVVDANGDWIPIQKEDYPEDSFGDHEGSHKYGVVYRDTLCTGFYEKINQQGVEKKVCITADGRLLDGNTGASRPNLFLQRYKKADGTFSAWAIFAYDESKGMGSGPPGHVPDEGPYGDEYSPEEGKNSLYHSFDFKNPDTVSAGTLINLPQKEYTVEVDPVTGHVDGVTIVSNISYIKDENGDLILDWQGKPQINYENARRPRFIMQGKNGLGLSGTIMLIVYKEGEEGSGRPSDIMLRRMVVPVGQTGNPYRPENIKCNAWEIADNENYVCVDGTQNMSTVNPTITTPPLGDPQTENPYGDLKVVEWEQTPDILGWPSGVNRYEDARAHRGALTGDFVVMGYSYTPNWAAYRNGNDKYDFYVRRSFDGGQTWTTDPNGSGVTHCDIFTDPTRDEAGNPIDKTASDGSGPHYKYEVCWTFGPGEFERARNLSQLANSKSSVIEPRIQKAPGPITVGGAISGHPEDCSNPNLFYVSFGTATNPGMAVGNVDDDDELEDAAPMDLYYSFSYDLGENYVEVDWYVNPDSEGNYAGEIVTRWDYLAKGDPEQGEAQLRLTPDGSRFYATWVQDGLDKYGNPASDIWMRRIMPPAFYNGTINPSGNVCKMPQTPPIPPTETIIFFPTFLN